MIDSINKIFSNHSNYSYWFKTLKVDEYNISGILIQRIFVSTIVFMGTVIVNDRLTFSALAARLDNYNSYVYSS